MSATVFSNNSECVKLPIVMYHSVLKDTDLSGKYVITPSTLENDIIFLQKRGFSFVSVKELTDYTTLDTPLPEKPIMLTFDDGCYNSLGYVKPILDKYNAKAVISVVGSYTDEYTESNIANMTYGYLRWCDVNTLAADENIDIGNHSYSFHSNNKGRNGSKRIKGESSDEYKKLFTDDTSLAQEKFLSNIGSAPIVYTYPFGAYSEETCEYLKEMGFKMTLTCSEVINIITKNPDSLFLLKRYNRPSGISSSEFFDNILKNI
jgi:peptidoglycan/xylan/chitin deacetylase (PgdA/CDA1 family)